MAFRKFLSALGVSAPEVETVLDEHQVQPGQELSGTVTVRGGAVDVEIERFQAELVVRFENHGAEARYLHVVEAREFGAPFTLAAGEVRTHAFTFRLPLGMPLTHCDGERLRGAYSAVRTELAIDNAVDRGDLDEVEVHALPSQAAVLRAYQALGFRHVDTEVKPGRAMNSRQEVDWWQEFELAFPPGYRPAMLEMMIVTLPEVIDVCAGGWAPRLSLTHEEAAADQAALNARLEAHMKEQYGA
ncbi:sporulation protein [Streptomyces sp. NPDC000983]|uniref:sporulation protein n=1 Tax=Streptomyces sp. NPDC000983 TaxID=3154373 RepID=UPI00332D7EDE